MPHQDIDILNSIYKNASMATQAINKVIPKAKNPKLKHELKSQRNHYHEVCENIRSEIYSINGEPCEISPVTKLFSDVSINLSTTINPSTSHIAEMMIQGTNMGIVDIIKAMNCYQNIEPELKNQANKILTREQEFLDGMKKYL